eukprot:COSAG02_NODE_11957_length_1626_cov_1.641547_1_plen_146_part_00
MRCTPHPVASVVLTVENHCSFCPFPCFVYAVAPNRTLRQANAGLEHIAQPLAERGFLSVADLLEADAKELSDALQQLQLKAPEHRRLRRLLDAAAKGELLEQNEASTLQMPDSAEALVAALQRQNLDRLSQPLADHGYHGACDKG